MTGNSLVLVLTGWFFLASSVGVYAQDAVADPVASIEEGNLHVRLKEWVVLPKSSSVKPYARINMLRELPDGSGRLAVNDLNGPFYLIADSNQIEEYLNLKYFFPDLQYTNGKGSGFGGFAFHPEFSSNGIFFTSHSEPPGKVEADFKAIHDSEIDVQWVLTRWTANDPSSSEFSGSREEIARWDFPTVIHGVQDLSFNPHAQPGDQDYGLLYIGIGEGGSGLHGLHKNVQTPGSHLGTIWRIDPLGTNSQNGKYGIPSDNPSYIYSETSFREVWAYGFRNPHRLHFEKQYNADVALYTGDIGELNIEEINHVVKAGNYGWPKREGTYLFDIEKSRETLYELAANESGDFIYPVAQYDHDDGLALNLGHVWHSVRVPEFEGIFFMGDIPTGRIFYVHSDSLRQGRQSPLLAAKSYNSLNEEMPLSKIVDHERVDIKFGYDHSGEVYFLTKANGVIYKIDVPGSEVIDTTSSVLNTASKWKDAAVYPTVVTHELFVDGIGREVMVSVVDIKGRVFIRRPIGPSKSLDVSQLKPGVFILMIEADGQLIQDRFIKVNE